MIIACRTTKIGYTLSYILLTRTTATEQNYRYLLFGDYVE